jgi:hypothetical protein
MQTSADVAIEDLIGPTLLIAVGFLLAVAFYETLSARDVLVRRTRGIAGRLSHRPWVRGLIYVAVVAIGIPALVLLWTIVLDAALFVLSPPEMIGTVSIVAVSVVGATRILAYANGRAAHELAKALPLALLFLLVTGGNPNFELKAEVLQERDAMDLTDSMLAFLIVLEIGLRTLTDGSHEILAWVRRRRGSDSDMGVWRTWATTLGLGRVDQHADPGRGEQGTPAPPGDP